MADVHPHTLPAVHAAHLVELVGRFGVTPEALLGPLGLSQEALSDPRERLSLEQVSSLLERARILTGESGLGFYLGLAMRVSWHGYLGFAAMTAGTLREAIELAVKFMPTRTTALALRLHVEGERAALVLSEQAPLGPGREVLVTALLVGISQIASTLTGRVSRGRVELALPQPADFSRFSHLLTGETHFDQPGHQLVFDAAMLDLPLQLADPAALKLATEQCERELAALGFQSRLSVKLRALLAQHRAEAGLPFPNVDAAASALHLSPRTLKRKLALEGTTFSALLDEERRDRALLLLNSDTLSMDQIAERVGYADAAAFTRAFTRWTGRPPGAFRKRER